MSNKINYLEVIDEKNFPKIYDELIIEAMATGRYSLTHYYQVKECITCFEDGIKTYGLTASEKYEDDFMKIPYLYDAFILKLIEKFPYHDYLISKLKQDVRFEYDAWNHSLTVSIKVQFKEKTKLDYM